MTTPTLTRVRLSPAYKFVSAHGESLLAVAVFTALSVVMTAEYWNSAWPGGHEDSRYVTRAAEYLRDWRDGVWYPRWAPDLYGGYGSPLFDFFPPAIFTLTAMIAMLGFSVLTAIKLATIAITLVGGAGAYWLAFGETKQRDAALVAGTAFIFMPYRFVDLLMRNDLCEYAAISMVPWTLYFYRELTRVAPDRLPRTMFYAALAQAGTMLGHPIIGMWTIVILPAVFLWPAIRALYHGDRLRALSPFLAGVGGAALSALYAVPAFADKPLCHFDKMVSGYFIAANHVVPVELFFNLFWYENSTDYPPNVRMPFSIGVPLVVTMLMVVACLPFAEPRRLLRRSIPWWWMLALLMFLMSPAGAWVYDLPLANFIQFPWRLLGLLCAVGAGCIGTTLAAFVTIRYVRPLRLSLGLLAIVGIVLGADPFEMARGYLPIGKLQMTPEVISAGVSDGTTNDNEHLPKLADRPPPHVRDKAQLVVPVSGELSTAVGTQRKGTDYQIDVTAKGAWAVDLQTFNFPGWHVETVQGPGDVTIESSPAALIRLSGTRAGIYRVHVWFGWTPVRTISTIVSLLCLLLMLPGLRWLATLPPFRAPPAAPTEPTAVAT